MRHFPIYLDMKGKLVVLSGAGPVAVPKLRLLLKTSARIRVFGFDAEESIRKLGCGGPSRMAGARTGSGRTLRARRFSIARTTTRRKTRRPLRWARAPERS